MVVGIVDREVDRGDEILKYLAGRFADLEIFNCESLDRLQKQVLKIPELVICQADNLRASAASIALFVKLNPSVAVFVVEAAPSAFNALYYLKLGAVGYAGRQAGFDAIGKGVEEIRQGKVYVQEEILQLAVSSHINYELRPHRKHLLTERELKVANYLIQGIGVSMIASILGRDKSTVSLAKSKIFRKLKVSSVFELRDKLVNGEW